MNKKGQVYILVAIILCVALFGIVVVVNKVEQDPMVDDFEAISRNYDVESDKFLNSLLNTGDDVFGSFSNFSYLFTGYSKSKTPGYGLIYALGFGDEVYIGNFLDQDVSVFSGVCSGDSCSYSEVGVLDGCYSLIRADVSFSGISVGVGGSIGDITIDSCLTRIGYSERLLVLIDGVFYPFDVGQGRPELMIVGRLDKAEQRKVFVGDQYVRPNSGDSGL